MIRSAARRRGLTLVELVVVIGLILVLSVLALAISPRMREDQRSARTADLISGWLLTAKQRAYRDQQVRGIRLIVEPGTNFVRKVIYVERPEDYRGGTLQVPQPAEPASRWSDLPPIVASNPNCTAFVHGKDLTNIGGEPIVAVNDFLVFDTLETIPYNSHHVWDVRFFDGSDGGPIGTRIVCVSMDGSQHSVINSGVPIASLPSSEFRFVRQPRPLAGENEMQLPRDMVIDVDPALPGGSVLPALSVGGGDAADILFSPRGQVTGGNAIGGKIILRIRNDTHGPLEGDQLYVVVYTRSGLIAAHPINTTADPVGNVDFYKFLKDGNSSGF